MARVHGLPAVALTYPTAGKESRQEHHRSTATIKIEALMAKSGLVTIVASTRKRPATNIRRARKGRKGLRQRTSFKKCNNHVGHLLEIRHHIVAHSRKHSATHHLQLRYQHHLPHGMASSCTNVCSPSTDFIPRPVLLPRIYNGEQAILVPFSIPPMRHYDFLHLHQPFFGQHSHPSAHAVLLSRSPTSHGNSFLSNVLGK